MKQKVLIDKMAEMIKELERGGEEKKNGKMKCEKEGS